MSLTAEFLDQRRHEVQRTSHFKIQIQGITEELTLHTRNLSLPTKSHAVITTDYMNEQNKQAGQRSFGDTSMSVHDAVGLDIERQLMNWSELIQNTQTGVMGYADQYKRTAIVTEYTVNGTVRSQWKYQGVWPSSLSFGDLSRDGNEKKSVNMTLTYDKAWLL